MVDYLDMLCSNIDVQRDNVSVQITFEVLNKVRAIMTARQQKCFDSKEKRVAALFFLELGASSMQFNSFRRSMDLVSTHSRSWEDQHLAQGLGTGQSRRTAMGNRRGLTKSFPEDFHSWMRREGSDVFMVILVHDDFMKQKKLFQFDLRDTGSSLRSLSHQN